MIMEQRPTVRTPENKDKKNDNVIKCRYVKCKISHINSSRYVDDILD
jgi:hypothetical protein